VGEVGGEGEGGGGGVDEVVEAGEDLLVGGGGELDQEGCVGEDADPELGRIHLLISQTPVPKRSDFSGMQGGIAEKLIVEVTIPVHILHPLPTKLTHPSIHEHNTKPVHLNPLLHSKPHASRLPQHPLNPLNLPISYVVDITLAQLRIYICEIFVLHEASRSRA